MSEFGEAEAWSNIEHFEGPVRPSAQAARLLAKVFRERAATESDPELKAISAELAADQQAMAKTLAEIEEHDADW